MKKILVTGAEGALGRVVCQRFLQQGFEVAGTYHRHPFTPAEGGEKIRWMQLDLADPKKVKTCIAQLQSELGSVDALIHCAGGFRYASIEQVTDEDIEFLIGSNLKSTIYLLREVLPGMKKSGFGRIVLVGSAATHAPPAGMGAYAATKAGINMLVMSVAEEVKPFDININAVLPSMIDTSANRQAMPGADPSAWVPPTELAEIIFSLTQPWGKSVNGALIPVQGRV